MYKDRKEHNEIISHIFGNIICALCPFLVEPAKDLGFRAYMIFFFWMKTHTTGFVPIVELSPICCYHPVIHVHAHC